eukprot:gene14291-5327_t
MLTYNNTKAQDDYLVIIGPEGSGPNLYKIATIILLFVAAVSLVALQMCRRRYFVLVWHWIICKKTLEHPEAVSEKRKKVVSIESTTCPSLSKSDDTGPDMVAKETHSMLALRIDDHIESPSNGTNFRKKFKRSDVYREPGKEEDQFEKAGLANSSEAAATADQIQAKQHVNDHGNDEFQKDEQLKSETKFLQSQRQQRHRRSGVCLSMLGRNSLPQTLKEVNADGQMEQANDLPLLQVNGIECEVDKECSEASIKRTGGKASGVAGRPMEWREVQWSGGKANGVAGSPVEWRKVQWSVGKSSGLAGSPVEWWEVQWTGGKSSGVAGSPVEWREVQ